MIEIAKGDLLTASAEALVNAVNTVGVMGKGIALQFREKFPEMFRVYELACRAGEVRVGGMHVFDRGASISSGRWIVNFPTKRHWREPSRIADIDAGLVDLVAVVRRLGIKSIAIPPLGCGLGGLNWNEVRPRIESAFEAEKEVRVLLFCPFEHVSRR